MRGNTGISKLLAAESEAAEIVAEARRHRLSKLKQAKEAAGEAIEEFRESMAAEFEGSGDAESSLDKYRQELEEETARKRAEIQEGYLKNKDRMVQVLASVVTSVEVGVPKTHAESLKAMNR